MTSKFNDYFNEQMGRLDEFVKKEYYRDASGKMKVKHRASRPGYRVKMIKGKPKEVPMSSKEKQNRKKAAKKSALKRYKKITTVKQPKKMVKIGG